MDEDGEGRWSRKKSSSGHLKGASSKPSFVSATLHPVGTWCGILTFLVHGGISLPMWTPKAWSLLCNLKWNDGHTSDWSAWGRWWHQAQGLRDPHLWGKRRAEVPALLCGLCLWGVRPASGGRGSAALGSKKMDRLLGLWAEWWERPRHTGRKVKPCLVLFLDTLVILLQGHFPYFEVSLSWSSQITEFSIFRWLGIPPAWVFLHSPTSDSFEVGLDRGWLCIFHVCIQGSLWRLRGGSWNPCSSWTTFFLWHWCSSCLLAVAVNLCFG